jgi:hypothetical protein
MFSSVDFTCLRRLNMKKFIPSFVLSFVFALACAFGAPAKAVAQQGVVDVEPSVRTYWGADRYGHRVVMVNRYWAEYRIRHGLSVGYGAESYGGYYDQMSNTVSMQAYAGYNPQYGFGYNGTKVIVITVGNNGGYGNGYYNGPQYQGQGGGYINRQGYGNNWQGSKNNRQNDGWQTSTRGGNDRR